MPHYICLASGQKNNILDFKNQWYIGIFMSQRDREREREKGEIEQEQEPEPEPEPEPER